MKKYLIRTLVYLFLFLNISIANAASSDAHALCVAMVDGLKPDHIKESPNEYLIGTDVLCENDKLVFVYRMNDDSIKLLEDMKKTSAKLANVNEFSELNEGQLAILKIGMRARINYDSCQEIISSDDPEMLKSFFTRIPIIHRIYDRKNKYLGDIEFDAQECEI